MGTALTERQLRELSPADAQGLPLLRRRRGRRGGGAARDGARGRTGVRRARGHAAARNRPRRRRPSGSTSGWQAPRATSATACGWRSSARRTGRRRSCASARRCRGFEDSPERQDAVRLAADRLDLPKETQAGLAPGRGRGGDGHDLAAAARGGRAAGARRARGRRRASGPARPPRGARARALRRRSSTGAHARTSLEPGEPADAELVAAARRARRARRGGRDRRGDRPELLLRLRERQLRRELAGADPERTKELQEQLERVRATAANLA